MALVDSSAAFKQRCMALDHSGELWKGLAAEQVETFAQLAFVLGTPQGPPGQEQFEQLAGKVWESPSLGDLAHLRLLLSARAQPESFSIGPHPQRTVRAKAQRQKAKLGIEPMCWSFNASGHAQTVSRNPPACRKGEHECMLCGRSNHGAQACAAQNNN